VQPPELTHGQTVVFGGVEFRVEVVSATYKKLVPLRDRDWMLRRCEMVAGERKK
jgi:hypothetical protein